VGTGAVLIEEAELNRSYPNTAAYLTEVRSLLDLRDRGSAAGPEWYRYIRTQNIALQHYPKLAIPRLVTRLQAAYDESGAFCLDNVDVGGLTLSADGTSSYLYILGLLNSRLLNFYFVHSAGRFRGGFFSANRQYIENIPVYQIEFADPADRARHDRMVALVERMLTLHKQQAAATTGHDKTLIGRQIEATDRQIDRLVYELYGLTEEEIGIVEGRETSREKAHPTAREMT
jgi:hypothetical protein